MWFVYCTWHVGQVCRALWLLAKNTTSLNANRWGDCEGDEGLFQQLSDYCYKEFKFNSNVVDSHFRTFYEVPPTCRHQTSDRVTTTSMDPAKSVYFSIMCRAGPIKLIDLNRSKLNRSVMDPQKNKWIFHVFPFLVT